MSTSQLFASITENPYTRDDLNTAQQSWRTNHPKQPAWQAHLWTISSYDNLTVPILGHDIAVLDLDLSCEHRDNNHDERCQCTTDTLVKSVCFTCNWESATASNSYSQAKLWNRPRVNVIHQAHDHACPGWRDLPVMTAPRGETTTAQDTKYHNDIRAQYPAQWHTLGAPIITDRTPGATRDVPGKSPWKGYDLAATDNAGFTGSLF